MIKRVLKVFFLVLAPPAAWPFAVAGANPLTGAEVYAQSCAMCHSTGNGGAPRLEDLRHSRGGSANGRAELLLAVLRGKGAMPPKGGNASLSTAEASAALNYMLDAPPGRLGARDR
jgi:cytochrome c5